MISRLTYKSRFFILSGSILIGLILIYLIAFKETLKVRYQYNLLNEKYLLIDKAPTEILIIEKRLNEISERIGGKVSFTQEFQRKLLEEISAYCIEYSLILREFPQLHISEIKEYQFVTGYAKIEGSFIPLLKLLNKMEFENNLGRVVSVDFQAFEDRKSKRQKLTMALYIQTIK